LSEETVATETSPAQSPGRLGSNQSGMRARNERLVLSLVRRHRELPKVEIARMTGLSAQTVSVIMRALEEEGLLARGEPLRGKVGQPSVPMHLAADGAFFYGLKIGRRSMDLVQIDFLGNVRARERVTYAYPTPTGALDFAARAFGRLQEGLPSAHRSRVAGMGIAMPFRLWDWAEPLGVPQSGMADWRHRDIRAELEDLLGLPVFMENDASAACGAELVFGTGDFPSDFLYFYLGFFIGGGVVLGGSLFTGTTGNAGALGSMPVPDVTGSVTQLINVASLSSLETALRATGQDASGLWEFPRAWPFSGPEIDRWIGEAGAGLAYCIASAACVLDVGTVVIDGWLPEDFRDELVSRAAAALERIDLSGTTRPVLRHGTVGPDARSLGAASLPLSHRFLLGAV
jgi:predicted NBD/HSP70 family sugar kinase